MSQVRDTTHLDFIRSRKSSGRPPRVNLLSPGFTSGIASRPVLVPIGDHDQGRYQLLSVGGFLVDQEN
jgi:hypothetical protein